MNHMWRQQRTTRGDHRFPHRNGSLSHRFFFNDIATLTFNGTCHTGAHPEMVVGRIDDRVHLKCSNISLLQFDHRFFDCNFHCLKD